MPFTTVQYIRMVQVAVVTATTTQYTVPAARQDVLKDIEICNTGASAITFSLYVVPSGGSATTATAILLSVGIPGNQTLHWTGTVVMNANDFIATGASATGLTMTVSGLESQ
jgi:hypothetical protein